MRKLRLKEMAKPVWFYAKFDEEWRVEHHGKSDWANGMCSTQQTVGNLATPVCSDAFWHPIVFGDKDAPSIWVWGEDLSNEGFMKPLFERSSTHL